MKFACDAGWPLMFHIGRNHPEIRRMWSQFDVRTYRQAARQGILAGAYGFGATYLLMLDDDHVFFPETFDLLWNVRKEAPIVGALYTTRSSNPAPCIFKITNEGTTPIWYFELGKVIDVDVIGFGFMLIDLKVLDLMIPNTRRDKDGIPQLFDLGEGFGEDAAFSTRFFHAGVPTKCHTGAQIGHIIEDPQVVWPEDYIRDRPRIIQGQMGTTEWAERGILPPEHAILGKMGAKPFWRPRATRHWFGGKVPGTERPDPDGFTGKGEDLERKEKDAAKAKAANDKLIDEVRIDTKL